ncbi:hypothetical protein HanRHA438_Chr08g0349251 [Helianthus annuus]|nr:hypothetical protein HanRHA438_Chr08g0349251 [Helianthus annuus]
MVMINCCRGLLRYKWSDMEQKRVEANKLASEKKTKFKYEFKLFSRYCKLYFYQGADSEVCSQFHSELYISTCTYYAQPCYDHYQNDNFLIQNVVTRTRKYKF